MNRRERAESLDAASWKIRETRPWRFPLACVDDPLRDGAARGFSVHAGVGRARATRGAEAERQREIVLCGEPNPVLLMMELMSESHERWAFEFD